MGGLGNLENSGEAKKDQERVVEETRTNLADLREQIRSRYGKRGGFDFGKRVEVKELGGDTKGGGEKVMGRNLGEKGEWRDGEIVGKGVGKPKGFIVYKSVPADVGRKAKFYLGKLHSEGGVLNSYYIERRGNEEVMYKLEWHWHPLNFIGGPRGWHKGVTAYRRPAGSGFSVEGV